MKFLSALVAVVVGVSLMTVAPAYAKREPGRVGMLVMESSTRTSLTFSWKHEPRAQHYVVERGRNLAMARRADIDKTKKNRITVRGLQPGELYCFTVRAKNKAGTGHRSHKACQRPSVATGSARGAAYRVVTFNTCASACGGWGRRRDRAGALVRRARPAVVMLQETPEDARMAKAVGGMTQVSAFRGKVLLARTSRFKVAQDRRGHRLAGHFSLGRDTARRGSGERWAVWAELVDRRHHNKHVLFVSAHFAPGPDSRRIDDRRERNARHLARGIDRVKRRGVPVVLGGDFNSHQGRDHNTASRALRRGTGLENAYFMARRWDRGNYNSATGGRAKPTVDTAWGHHIDQVWVNPRTSVVERWANVNRIVGGRYPRPMISDHSPVLVKVRVS